MPSLRDAPTPFVRRLVPWLLATVVGCVAYAFAAQHLARERRAFVDRRLAAAADVLTAPARDVLTGAASAESFRPRLRDLGTVSGLRITLIAPDGEALVDSELPGALPNLGDRPEIRGALSAGVATAERLSVLTGRETLYVARAVAHEGRTVGTIRAATNASSVEELLAGAELLFALAAVAGVGIGFAIRARCALRSVDDERDAGSSSGPHPLRRVA